jgi:hypothetical protein
MHCQRQHRYVISEFVAQFDLCVAAHRVTYVVAMLQRKHNVCMRVAERRRVRMRTSRTSVPRAGPSAACDRCMRITILNTAIVFHLDLMTTNALPRRPTFVQVIIVVCAPRRRTVEQTN